MTEAKKNKAGPNCRQRPNRDELAHINLFNKWKVISLKWQTEVKTKIRTKTITGGKGTEGNMTNSKTKGKTQMYIRRGRLTRHR